MKKSNQSRKVKKLKNQKIYEIVDGKLVRKQPFCPRCGKGIFMADHGDFCHAENVEIDIIKTLSDKEW